jgi:hypothetical protein
VRCPRGDTPHTHTADICGEVMDRLTRATRVRPPGRSIVAQLELELELELEGAAGSVDDGLG